MQGRDVDGSESAVVIGATGGIGAAVTRRLVDDGRFAAVHALSRTGQPVDGALAGRIDLEAEASIAQAAARIAEGPAPTLVLIATGVLHDGFQPERSLAAVDPEHLLRDYRINTVGPALAAKHLVPLMARDRRGVFAALSARVGSIGDNRLGGWHAYRASKAALNMLLKTLSIETRRTHPELVVVGLHPGTVATELSAPFQRGVKPDALFQPDRAADHLLGVISRLTADDSGSVKAWDGSTIPY